jgi:transposase
MGNKKPQYTLEYKAEAVRLFREGSKSIGLTARDIGVSESALRKWVRQAEIDEGTGPKGALTTEERAELTRLRKDYQRVKMERDFLKKVSTFFAKENS